MDSNFLQKFLRLSQAVTEAEHGVAVDTELTIKGSIDVDDALLQSESFQELVRSTTGEALKKNEAVISNNIITDPSDAPRTNVHLTNLRMIVALPLPGYGAIYLDQHIRNGVFSRETLNRLSKLARRCIEKEETNLSYENLLAHYEQVEV